jgi:hypothetical protein
MQSPMRALLYGIAILFVWVSLVEFSTGGAYIPESGGIRSRNCGRAQVLSCLGLLVSTPTLQLGDLQGSREQTGNALPLRVLRSGTPNADFIGHDLPVNPLREEAQERHGHRARYGLASSIDGATRRHVEVPVEHAGRQRPYDQGQAVEIGPSTIRSRPTPDQCRDHRNQRNGQQHRHEYPRTASEHVRQVEERNEPGAGSHQRQESDQPGGGNAPSGFGPLSGDGT